jgi:hypothetical protein
LAIGAVTAFLIIGSAPHIVWLRILSLPGPALILVLGGGILLPTVYHVMNKPAPFRFSSTAKGEAVLPGVFYICEDVIAVNANAGRPYREAIHARYEASPMFRKMMLNLSWAYSIPPIIIAIVLIVVICIHEVSKEVAYGLGMLQPVSLLFDTNFARLGSSLRLGSDSGHTDSAIRSMGYGQREGDVGERPARPGAEAGGDRIRTAERAGADARGKSDVFCRQQRGTGASASCQSCE